MKQPCSIAGCDSPQKARGWCSRHYSRWQATGDPTRPYVRERSKGECRVDGCEFPARSKRLCNAHYQRLKKYGDVQADKPRRRKKNSAAPPCKIAACSNRADSRGWCATHYSRWLRLGDPEYPNRSPRRQTCVVEGCDRLWLSKQMCQLHYRRWQKHGDPNFDWREVRRVARRGTKYRTTSGYIEVYDPYHPNARRQSGMVAEHVIVMAAKIGRPLRKGETVHHINGIRDDNRPENLELWISAHRPGQRVSELIAWAHELLEQYADDIQLWPEHLEPPCIRR